MLVKAKLENMHSQQLINYFNAIHHLYSPPKKKHLKLSKCNWFERELGKVHVFSGTQKTHIVKSWFLQAQSLEMCEWFQLFQWDVFVFLKIMCATLAIQSQVLGTSSQDCEVFCQCQELGFTCTHCFDQWIKSP